MTNSIFWKKKLENNKKNDKVNVRKLKSAGWRVIVVWECEIEKYLDQTVQKLISKIITSG